MILYDKDNNKYTLIKTTRPKFEGKYKYSWGYKNIKIGEESTTLYFRYTGYFYLHTLGEWYKTSYDGDSSTLSFAFTPDLFFRKEKLEK